MKMNKIIKKIDELPLLSDAVVSIQDMYNKDFQNINIPNLVSLIESDALLSANILKMSNAPMYGFSRKITSISQAVTLFGIMQVYAFVINYAIQENLRANTELFGLSKERFNDMCHLQSILLSKWYAKIDLEDARVLSSLALVMEAGKLVLAMSITNDEDEKKFTKGLKDSEDILAYEKDFFGINSYEASALLFEHWNMNSIYIDVLKSFGDAQISNKKIALYAKILKAISSAINIKEVLTKQSAYNACIHIKKLGLEIDDFITVGLNVKKLYLKELKQRKNG